VPKVTADLPRRCEYIVNRKENGKAAVPVAPRPGHAANAIVDTCPVSDSQTRFFMFAGESLWDRGLLWMVDDSE